MLDIAQAGCRSDGKRSSLDSDEIEFGDSQDVHQSEGAGEIDLYIVDQVGASGQNLGSIPV